MSGTSHADGLAHRIRFPASPSDGTGIGPAINPAVLMAGTVRVAGVSPVRDVSTMTRDGDHFRLAVATFDEPQSLRRAVEALSVAGLSCDQLCLLARTETLAALAGIARDHGAASPSFRHLMQRLEIWPGASGDGSVAATSGPLFESLACLQRGALAGGEGSLQAAQRPDFGEHLAAGTITIVVRSTTPAQQSIATRTLLSQSSHRVKTYEFTSAEGEKPA